MKEMGCSFSLPRESGSRKRQISLHRLFIVNNMMSSAFFIKHILFSR